MAESLGSAVLTLSVDDRQYNAGLQRARQKADSSLGGVKGADLGGAGLTALTGGLTAAAVGAAAVGAAVIGIGAAAVQSAGSAQKLQAAFTGLTGSAEAASQLRQQLFDLSKTTPFKNEEILQASQRFLAVGVNVESLNGTINRVGALAAQAGQPLERLALIYAQVYAKGRLQGEENLQLLEAGVDLSQELAQVTGLTGSALQDAMSKGQIGINAFNEALVLATGDMKALQQAGKAVDVQFNNIGDNLGQLFGGFAQAISPALSAAFKVINDIFDTAFPDLNSIVDFFAPLTKEAQRFADVLGSSPGIIEIVAAGLKSLGGVIIQNIADGISFVSDLLANVDQSKFIQGFIDAELVVRRLLLASSALGAQLVKNAELSARAVSNPLQFGRDIAESGGFGQFIEKEYKTVERKWNDWANSEPLKFPDLAGKGSGQIDKITGNLSSKATQVKDALVQGAEALKKAAEDSASRFIDASRQLLDARLKLSETQANPQGLNRFLQPDDVFTRIRGAITRLGPEVESAIKRGSKLLRSQGVGAGQPLFQDIRDILTRAQSGTFASTAGLQAITQFINDVNAETDAIAGVNSAQDQVNAINKELVGVNTSLRDQVAALVQKAWNVQVNVASDGSSQAFGDVLAGAVSP